MTDHNAIHDQAIELLLDSMSQQPDDYLLRSSFLFAKPGAHLWQRRLGTDVFYHSGRLIRAALHVRQNGPSYLRYLPISAIWSMLQRFVVDQYWLLADEAFLKSFDGSYAGNISKTTKSRFAEALAASEIFQPRNEVTLFPIVPLTLLAEFDSLPFFFARATTSSLREKLPQCAIKFALVGEIFPPLSDFNGRSEKPAVWLGIKSPDFLASNKIKAAILGALALTPQARYRHMFSGRQTFGGRCTISEDGRTTVSLGESHTPPLMHDIIIGQQDAAWLNILASKLVSNEKTAARQIKALEYFYRAWPLDPAERFPILCMTLDALFGESQQATKSVINGVRSTLGSHVPEPRLSLLMDLRNSVLHGGAPDVYDSRKYAKYYDQFGEDPIRDLELVAGRCLRSKVFDDTLNEHADPNEEIFLQAQAAGRLPMKLFPPSILDPPS
jgi:hypothetical protein